MIGRTLSHYEITAKLGEGGMGEVFEARDTDLKRLVALKVLPAELAEDPERLERFRREAESLAAFSHPNIVTLYSVERAGELHFLTMERVSGRSLDQLIPDGGYELEDLLRLVIPLTEALAAAHDKGIIHRDLKPANVMVSEEGQLKVLDFGLAKLDLEPAGDEVSQLKTMETRAAMTREGVILGTVPYMSPEQAQGRPVDPRSDIFSLGIMLYEMATGRHPFQGETAVAVLSAIIGQRPLAMAEVRRGLPWQLERVVDRCLAKDPDQRVQSVVEIRGQLVELRDQYRAGRAGGWRARSFVRRFRRSFLGRTAWARTMAALAGLAIVAALAAWFLPRTSAPQGPEPLPAFRLTQLTDLPGYEGEPVLSPDGSQLLYVGDAAGNRDIYLQRVGGERAINLTGDYAGDDYHPAFSPDGQRIAFRSERGGGGLFVMGATGESPTRIADGGFHPAWRPDGAALIYSTTLTTLHLRGELTGLWEVSLDGGAVRQVLEPDVAQAQFAPQGARVAFWSKDGGIWTAPVWADEPTPFPGDPDNQYNDWGPVWAGDGSHLYFVSDRGGQFNIWRAAVDEATGNALGAPQAVATSSEPLGRPSLSRDGQRLAYAVSSRSGEIFEVGFDPLSEVMTGKPTPVLRSTRPFLNAVVSPGGGGIVYSSTEPQEDLFTVRADGTGKIQLTDDGYLDRGPRWSPDGSRIAFYSQRTSPKNDHRMSIWTINPDGGDLRLLLDDPTMTIQAPTWSADGRALAVMEKKSGVYRLYRFDLIHLGEADPIRHLQLLAEGKDFAPISWSPDGRFLSGYGIEGGTVPLRVFELETGTFRTVKDVSGSVLQAVYSAFLSDSRRLLYCDWTNGALGIWDLATDEVREIPGPRFGAECKISLTADERKVVGNRIFQESDIWLLEFEQASTATGTQPANSRGPN